MAERRLRANQRKVRATTLDGILADFDADALAEFHEFCQHNRPCSDIQRWLKERGHDISLGIVQRWYRNTFPVGKDAKRLNSVMTGYNQINTRKALEYGLGVTVERLVEWKEKFDALPKENLSDQEKWERNRMEGLLPSYMRELRSIATNINEYETISDRKELELSGADAIIQELLIVFKDSPFEDALKEAIRGAMAKVEGR